MDSILTGTKKMLNLAEDYTAFDHDVITHINSAFSTLTQLGVGPVEGFMIEDASKKWTDFMAPNNSYNQIRSYIFLVTRMLFDPPTTSFHIEAMKNQIAEMEWRLSVTRENAL